MVPCGRKELVKKPAMPFGKSFLFLSCAFFFSLRTCLLLDEWWRCRASLTFIVIPPVCSLPSAVD
jgi:hypothetical protein